MSRRTDLAAADRRLTARIAGSGRGIGDTAVEKDWWVTATLGCAVEPVARKPDGTPVDHDSDPVVIEVAYPSVLSPGDYVRPMVKVEISCLSMREPCETREITPLVSERFPQADDETRCAIPTVLPSRTFLEKAFPLNEERQRRQPRTLRQSRHLYDLHRLMDTPFASAAPADTALYRDIVAHRRRFYHVGGVDYSLDLPQHIDFVPSGGLAARFRADYEAMRGSMIYGAAPSFDTLTAHLAELRRRFREVGGAVSTAAKQAMLPVRPHTGSYSSSSSTIPASGRPPIRKCSKASQASSKRRNVAVNSLSESHTQVSSTMK